MKEKRLPPKGKYAINVRIEMGRELIAICPKCGGEVALWSDEQDTVCIFCDHKLFDRESTLH